MLVQAADISECRHDLPTRLGPTFDLAIGDTRAERSVWILLQAERAETRTRYALMRTRDRRFDLRHKALLRAAGICVPGAHKGDHRIVGRRHGRRAAFPKLAAIRRIGQARPRQTLSQHLGAFIAENAAHDGIVGVELLAQFGEPEREIEFFEFRRHWPVRVEPLHHIVEPCFGEPLQTLGIRLLALRRATDDLPEAVEF